MKIEKINWHYDKIYDVENTLMRAQRLWDRQAFGKPTEAIRKTIIGLLKQAKKEIESILEEIS